MGEFDLIRRYFWKPAKRAVLGNGDDCALVRASAGCDLAISTDMLVSGVHFFPEVDPIRLGWKALAVNLSDLAAMGASPMSFTLALAIPEINESWVDGFARGLFECAEHYGCELIGGDTTRGPLAISITVLGEVPHHLALRRDAAVVGDDIWVSGQLGDAALALLMLRERLSIEDPDERSMLMDALEMPTPRIALAGSLRGVAHAAIDLSDGLAGDLEHILAASGVGASVFVEDVPSSAILRRQPFETRIACALSGGDDYELCMTAPVAVRESMEEAARDCGVALCRIGSIEALPGLRWLDRSGNPLQLSNEALHGHDHFA